MPPTLVTVAVGILIGVALLGPAFDRRSVVVVAIAAAVPNFDAAIGLFFPGATNAVLHSAFIPGVAALALYYDTERREPSWFRTRYGWYGIRLAWVAIAAYAIAGIGLDLFNIDSAAVLYPLSDRYYAITGKLVFSTQDGVIQTYVQWGDGWLQVASPGTTATHHVETWLDPSRGADSGVERRLRLIDSGWQLVVVATAAVALPAKFLLEGGVR
jgi:hypothetical protein